MIAHRLPMAILSGALIGLTVSGLDFGWLAWFATVPLLVSICGPIGLPKAFGLGAVAGAAKVAVVWHWLPGTAGYMTGNPTAGTAVLLVLALYWAVLVGIVCAGVVSLGWGLQGTNIPTRWTAWIAPPCLWVLIDFTDTAIMDRTSLIFASALGYSQWKHPVAIQVASLVGVAGIGFTLVAVSTGLALAVLERRWRPALIAVLAASTVMGFGFLRLTLAPEPLKSFAIPVAVLQGAIEPFDKFDPAASKLIAHRYLELSRQAVTNDPRFVVWTEAAIPWEMSDGDDLVTEALKITAPAGAIHIVGGVMRSRFNTNMFHNSAFLVNPDGRLTATCSKKHLIPSVETPLSFGQKRGTRFHPDQRLFLPGSGPSTMQSDSGLIGINICNENLYSRPSLSAVREGANFFVHLANDAWFRSDLVRRQHFAYNTIRAVEVARDIVVANNVGISAVVDAMGRVRTTTPMRTPYCLASYVHSRRGLTLYARTGDWFPALCASTLVVAWFQHRLRSRHRREAFTT